MTMTASSALLATALFSFHSNEWLNLHHFLRVVARGQPAAAELTAAERAAWDASVSFYRARYAERDLLFDPEMVAIKAELRRAEGKPSLAGLKLPEELVGALQRAQPVYRRHWWPRHDRDNRRWIAATEPLVAQHGPSIARAVAAAYGKTWPAEPVPVDLSVSAGRFGAYTTSPPTHVTMSSVDPTYQLNGLEMLFHEASHAWDDVLAKGIERAAAAQGRKVPGQLWHALLFFTAGELTRRELGAWGDEDYVEYALRGGNYTRACGEGCRALMSKHWGPRLDGRTSVEEALSALVAALPPEKRPETQKEE